MATEDVRIDIAAALKENAERTVPEAMHGGCTDYRCYCHDLLPPIGRRALAAEALLRRLVEEYDRDGSDSGSLSIVACEVVAVVRELLET